MLSTVRDIIQNPVNSKNKGITIPCSTGNNPSDCKNRGEILQLTAYPNSI